MVALAGSASKVPTNAETLILPAGAWKDHSPFSSASVNPIEPIVSSSRSMTSLRMHLFQLTVGLWEGSPLSLMVTEPEISAPE